MDARVFKTLRRLNDWTQHEAADKLGVSRALLAMVETDKAPISSRLERKINDAFGTDRIDLVKKSIDLFEGKRGFKE
ncbi:helix-turn-helix domain-containing protein [Halobacillus sp. Marseille-Q1614]|uniref:helix-turn-helix domain-containing protein n=1 Tax=Halobacillus sp. Marseille-Q1614 TaxID=2709134 RepID=UPI00156E42BF|nr:helix-turn-helix transcriptional regulator [Halobacillus sp. Marseille-Q1614]